MENKVKKDLQITKEEQMKAIKDAEDVVENSSIVDDNKIVFFHNNETYRVKMPNQYQKAKAEEEQHKLYGELIQTEGCYLREKLKQILKEKQGIDIYKLEEEKTKILQDFLSAQLDLALVPSDESERLEKAMNKVIEIREKLEKITVEIEDYLKHSIETRCDERYFAYLTPLCTEKLVNSKEDKWEYVWKTFEEFEKDSSMLVWKANNRLQYLLINVKNV